MLESLARWSHRRRRLVIVGWIGLLVAMTLTAASWGGESRNDFSLPGSESHAAADLLEAGGFGGRGGLTGQVVFAHDDVSDPEVRASMEAMFAEIRTVVPDVAVVSPYDQNGPGQVAPDETVAFALLEFGDVAVSDAQVSADRIVELRHEIDALPDGLQLELGGDLFYEEAEFSSEGIGLIAAVVILLIAFGSVLAMGLPILTALFGIGCGMAIVGLASNVLDIPDFAPAAVAMISIGVGIDYALVIVTRYREELAHGLTPADAVVRSLGTAGRAVLFAGTTVVISLGGLLVVGLSATRSLAVAVTAGVLMVMLASLTLLPALLGFAGHNIDRLRIRRTPGGAGAMSPVWFRWSRIVQRRPAPMAIAGFLVLSVLTLPTFAMRLGFGDAGNRPDTDTARRAYDLVADGFGPGVNGPLYLAIDLPDDGATDQVLGRLTRGLEDDPAVAAAMEPIVNAETGVAFTQVVPTTSPQSRETSHLVHRIRADIAPAAVEGTDARVLVGGGTAGVVDFSDLQSSRLPLFIGVVLVLSFVLLMAVFRSVLVPLKAVLMNLLSIGAAYGLLVMTFQWGWGADLLGVGEPGPIEAWVPMMLFAIVFGLSMDYEVFLLTRIKEHYDRTGDNATAVADGLARTARLITAAAGIMVFVFGGFVLSADRSLQLFGFGLAVAVLLDATLVRLVLVPATMELLGRRNWWLPAWLDRILPALHVDGREQADDVAPREPVITGQETRT